LFAKEEPTDKRSGLVDEAGRPALGILAEKDTRAASGVEEEKRLVEEHLGLLANLRLPPGIQFRGLDDHGSATVAATAATFHNSLLKQAFFALVRVMNRDCQRITREHGLVLGGRALLVVRFSPGLPARVTGQDVGHGMEYTTGTRFAGANGVWRLTEVGSCLHPETEGEWRIYRICHQ
jgi:ribosomal protein L35AE/L33A